MTLSYGSILLIIALLLLPLAIAYYARQRKTRPVRDPRRGLTPNATNYNINGILSEEIIEEADEAEIREIIQKVKDGEITSLSNEDFYRLQKKLKELA